MLERWNPNNHNAVQTGLIRFGDQISPGTPNQLREEDDYQLALYGFYWLILNVNKSVMKKTTK